MLQSKSSEGNLFETPKIRRERLQFKNANRCDLFYHDNYFFLTTMV